MARALSECGAAVAAVDRDTARLRETVDKLTADGLRAEAFPADVTSGAEIESTVDAVNRMVPRSHRKGKAMTGIPPIEPYMMPTVGDLPDAVARWTVDPDRAVLLIHDMQRYFLRPIPPEGPRDELVRNSAVLRASCAALGVPVAYTAQPGGMTEKQRGLLKDFWGPGMRIEPADQQVVEPLAPTPDDWVFTKWRYSAFFRSDLLERMRSHDRDQLIICGVYAHVGVLATAIDAFTHDIQTFLIADAVADFSQKYHRLALEYAAQRCAVVATVKEVLPSPRSRMECS